MVIMGLCFDETQMKKETKKLVGFEEALLSNYRHYLESLESFATGRSKFWFCLNVLWFLNKTQMEPCSFCIASST